MEYRYTEIFSIKGLNLAPAGEEKSLVDDSAVGLHAILTSQPNTHTFEGDRSRAVAGLILQGLFKSEPGGNEFNQWVAMAVEKLQATRQREFGNNPFLIVSIEGQVSSFNPSHERDTDDFVICFDAIDTIELRTELQDKITALLNSLVIEVETVISLRNIADSVVFFRGDGKPVYSYTPVLGTGSAYVSTPLADDRVQAIRDLFRLLSADASLQRVQRLIRSSFETEYDPLRSFLAAWSAFEIFVNKVFGEYETIFFDTMLKEGYLGVQGKYLARIREVMKDKYRFADKFAAISFQLSPATGDADLKIVLQAKKVRDELFHEGKVDEASLPVELVRGLVGKYLRLHIERRSERKVA